MTRSSKMRHERSSPGMLGAVALVAAGLGAAASALLMRGRQRRAEQALSMQAVAERTPPRPVTVVSSPHRPGDG
ncbi:hypothetical protein OSC27_11235 [Microbacterium sp. STN6]|uniref:hypothetical protein n=1 Tax=Microbacterium sp. STN6 TaxID=2995588 RepID=UPI002260889B|nr:hypothetical protein [Microbacterium sp. STN6]MCX7522848.1 hypothetical protein [Microbacterium sp. STN6]